MYRSILLPTVESLLRTLVIVVAFQVSVAAHVILTSHTTRHGASAIKEGPCGRRNSVRGDTVYIFEPGELVQLEWNEFISHPGYFRLSFDEEGVDGFIDPADYYDFFVDDSVLADDLFRHERRSEGATYAFDLLLPDVECDTCTIQLIQVMTDKPPFQTGTNDIYYNCLDVQLVRSHVASDFNLDNMVDGADALYLFQNWGPVPPGEAGADLNGDR